MKKLICALAIATSAMIACAEEVVCETDYDCPSTEVCNANSGDCEPLRCQVDDDCPGPKDRCQQNQCITGG